MQKKIIYVFLVTCITLFTGCTNTATENNTTLSESEQTVSDTQETVVDETTESSTGYPTGTVQKSYIMINDAVYVASDHESVSQIPDSFINIGAVSANNIYERPSVNFEASRIEEGTPVYANPEFYSILYIPVSEGLYREYIPE